MCDEVVILQNGGILMLILDCYKDQNMCNKTLDNYDHALGSVCDCSKTQNICDKVVSTYPSLIQLVPD